MKKRLMIIATLATVLLLFFVKTTSAQAELIECGKYNSVKKEVILPYYNDTVNIYFLYEKKGKFTYTDQDHKDGKYLTYQRVANKNFKKLESQDDITIPINFDNLKIFENVFKKYKKEDLQIKDVKVTCNVVIGSPGKWQTEVSVYLERKK